MLKKCRNCQSQKLIEEFPYFSTKEAGRKNTCKECTSKLSKIRQQLKLKNPQPLPGPCPKCSIHTEIWILDHCHFNDSFRGYVCNSCNLGLGRFNDDVFLLKKAIDYLKLNCVENQ